MKLKILHTLLLSAVLGMTACTRDTNVDEDTFEGEVSVTFSLPTSRGIDIDPEDEIREVRLIAFRTNSTGYETGELLLNKHQQVGVGNTSVNFKVTVPVGYINIYIIANESASNSGVGSLADISTVADISAKTTSYNTDKSPVAPFLMYGEFKRVKVNTDGSMTINGIPFAAAPNHPLEIQRTVAKVTLNLTCSYIKALPPETELFVEEIEVINLPKAPHLIPNHPYSGDYYEKGIYNNADEPNDQLSNRTVEAGKFENTQVFYIPEHIVREADTKTQLAIKAYARNSTSGNKVAGTEKIWYLVLGDGIANKTFEKAHELTGSDLNVTRNTHYKIIAEISNLTSDRNPMVELSVTIKNWNIDSFEPEFEAPYLNVSTLSTSLSIFDWVRVHFWSNQPNVIIEPNVKKGSYIGESVTANSIFYRLIGAGAQTKFSYSYNTETNSGIGFFDIMYDPTLISPTGKYMIYLRAGSVCREITVNSAPSSQVGGEADLLYFAPDGRLQIGKWGDPDEITAERPVHQRNIAFFKFGGVIGFTLLDENDIWNKVPTDQRVLFNTTGADYSSYTNIPCFDGSFMTASQWGEYDSDDCRNRFNISRYTLHTGASVKAGRGDPCRLVGLTGEEIRAMNELDIENYKSGWRLPNDWEQAIFCGLKDANKGAYSNSASKFPYYTGSLTSVTHLTSPGWARNPCGARLPIGGGTLASQYLYRYFNETGEYLPAAGQRYDDSSPIGVYSIGCYWSSIPISGIFGTSLHFDAINILPRGGGPSHFGRAIRCVRTQ